MKKKQVPAGHLATPAFVEAVRDNLEVLTGRRKNRITLPTVQDLSFSSPPTQAECQALNDYVNAWAAVIEALVGRLDD